MQSAWLGGNMVTTEMLKIGMKVKRNTRTWVDAKRLGIAERMLGEVLPNTTGIGIHVLFENGVDTYCWGDDLDAVPPNDAGERIGARKT